MASNNFDGCIKELTAVASKAFGKQEAKELFAKLQNTADQMQMASADERVKSIRAAAGEFAEAKLMQAKVNKRNLALSDITKSEISEHRTNFTNPADADRAYLVGGENLKFNVHGGVEQYQKGARLAVMEKFFGEVSDLKTTDGSQTVFDLLKGGQQDLALCEHLQALSDKQVKPTSVDPVTDAAMSSAAKVLRKYQDMTKNLLNLRGCNIVDLVGRITRQIHNPQEMLKMGKDTWMSLARETFHPETFKDLQGLERTPSDMLSSIFDATSSGVRKSYAGRSMDALESYSGNLANQISSQRLIKFKDAASFLKYRAAMKTPGSVFDDISKEIDRGFSNAALMRKMGPDPYGTMQWMKQSALGDNRTDQSIIGRLKSEYSDNGRLTNIFKNITGYTSVDHNPNVSRIFDTIRTFAALNTQWLSAVKSIPDVGAGVNQLSLWGRSTFGAMGDFAEAWSNHFGAKGGTAFEQGNRTAYYLAEQYFMGIHSDWRDGNDISGLNRKIMSSIYKWNQQERWDAVMKQAIGESVSRILGKYSSLPLDKINDKQFKNSLFKYGIDENTWNTIRQGIYEATDSGEHHYMTADTVQSRVPDSAILSYLKARGETPTEYAMGRARDDLATKVSIMLNDAGDHTITLAGANEKSIMNQGLQRGTGMRGLLDLVTQFKGYMLANAYRTWASQIYGRGSESIVDALMNKNGELPYIARNVAVGMAAWYIADTAKNALLGLGPKTVGGDNTTHANIKNGLEALAGSGGLGPYSDLLLTDFGSDKSAALAAVAGPTMGRAGQAAYLFWKSTIDQMGSAEEGEKAKFPAVQDIRFATENTPILSLPPVKMAANYLILYNLENWLDPMANKRREALINKDSGQNYFFPPSAQ